MITDSSRFRICVLLLAPAVLFLGVPVFGMLAFLGNSDALFYSNVLTMTSDALTRGELFPRWFSEANAGFGSPVMLFYAPLAYLITALIELPLAPLHPGPGTQLIIGMYASQVACGYTSYLWLKRSFPRNVAFIGSLAFVLLPYKLIYIYIHVNLAQLWALVLLPLWMIAAEKMATFPHKSRTVGLYALAGVAVYYTHPLTLIAFGAVPALYVLWFGRRNLRASFAALALAHLLIGLLFCMQLVPGHFFTPWIHAERFFQGSYGWQHNFFHIDVVLCTYYGIIALFVGVAIRLVPELRNSKAAAAGLFWIAVLAVVLFLTQRVSYWVWEVVTPLQYLQFPAARLHAAALMGVTWLICIWLSHCQSLMRLGPLLYRPASLVIMVVLFTGFTGVRVYKVESDPVNSSADYMVKGRAAKLITTPVALYETQWGCINAKKAFQLSERGKIPSPVSALSGDVTLLNREWHPPQHIFFHADVRSPVALLQVRQCYFPLWHARENQQQVALFPEDANGLIALSLPRGPHDITISLNTSPVETTSRSVSLCGLLILLGLLIFKEKPSQSGGASSPARKDFS